MKPLAPDKQKSYNSFLRYSGMGIQMVVTIVAGTFFGRWLDQKFQMSFPVFLLLGVLLSVFAAIYLAIKDLIRK